MNFSSKFELKLSKWARNFFFILWGPPSTQQTVRFSVRCRDRGAWCRDVIRSQQAWSSSRRVWRSSDRLSSWTSSRRQRKTSAGHGGTGRSGWSGGKRCTTRRLWTSRRSPAHRLGRCLGLWCWKPSYCDTPVNHPLYLWIEHLIESSTHIVDVLFNMYRSMRAGGGDFTKRNVPGVGHLTTTPEGWGFDLVPWFHNSMSHCA